MTERAAKRAANTSTDPLLWRRALERASACQATIVTEAADRDRRFWPWED